MPVIKALALILCLPLLLSAQSIKTDYGIYPEPSLPALPAAGGTLVDPTFGTTIMRLTDSVGGTNTDCYNAYAYYQAFNADNTLVKVQCVETVGGYIRARVYQFNPISFTSSSPANLFLSGGAIFDWDTLWSGTLPSVVFGHNNTVISSYNRSTDTYTTLKDCTSVLGGGQITQISMSIDDDVFAFHVSGGTKYVVWKRSTNTFLLNQTDSGVDEVRINKTGRYLNVSYSNGQNRIWDLQPVTPTSELVLYNSTERASYHTAQGTLGWMGTDAFNSGYHWHTYAAPHVFITLVDFPGGGDFYGHVSMLADNETWGMGSQYNNSIATVTQAFEQEIFQVKTDGSGSVRRLAHHRSLWNDYYDEPHAAISRDGRFIAFTSNWGNASGRRDVFILNSAQELTVNVATTSRQAVVTYTAPDTNPCTIEVSESASFTPLVNDVNTTLFTSANSDSRTGSLGTGTIARTMVIGTIQNPNGLAPFVALNTSTYSRALQVNTPHYFRVTCGSFTGTATATTKNPPLGMTRGNEMPLTAAGTYGFPTLNTSSRSEQIIDPVFGTLIRKVTIDEDEQVGGASSLLFGSGAPWPCAQSTVNNSSGTPGYLCGIPAENGPIRIYWVNTATGAVIRLGTPRAPSGVMTSIPTTYLSASVGSVFGTNPTQLFGLAQDTQTIPENHVIRCQLPASGSTYYDTDVSPTDFATCTWADLTPSVDMTDQLIAFDGAYDKTKFQYASALTQDKYLIFYLRRGVQDTHGWIGAFDTSLGVTANGVVAGMPLWLRGASAGMPGFRWCGIHTPHAALGTNKASFTAKAMYQTGGQGLTPYLSTMTSSCDAVTDPCVFTVNGSPVAEVTDPAMNVDAVLNADAAVGDQIAWTNNAVSERGIITAKTGNTWTVSRAKFGTSIAAHSNGTGVYMQCNCVNPGDFTQSGPAWWNFEADPHGNDTTGTNLIPQLPNSNLYNGHEGFANGYGIAEGGWYSFIGPAATNNSVFLIYDSPTFAGAAKNGSGNAWQKHASSAQQTNASVGQGTNWGVDSFELEGDSELSATSLTNVTGTLYKFTNTNYTLSRKKLAMVAFAGVHPLLDISSVSTGNVIGGLSGDSYKYCVANAANECRTGSVIGDAYINAPSIDGSSSCNVSFISAIDAHELCFGHPAGFGQSVLQIGMVGATNIGKYNRSLTNMLTPYKRWNPNADAHAMPDGKWVMFPTYSLTDHGQVWIVKAPPFPVYDNVDRNTFQQRAIVLSAVAGADNAIVKFGYDTTFNCTSRTEACISAASNNPYYFASESFTGTSCASGCAVSVPIIPDRVAYAQIIWRNGTTTVQSSSVIALTDRAEVTTAISGKVIISNKIVIQ